ncbi:MAG: amino acid ABC transporter substrate-binding protein [Candidatus Fraserbacteria bacterium RBG_16_55_9]|uniref:Amino acid ABC transporter substrate-binding protein n=1 Tax=Fraserbacteria sp. (strain RBG_16_55_9) TaxID=1817864 RepID=A0A1F5V0V3_FRAXR|nr:MAG: amino acid ABC transporter substrate-binding protein [Candidatus Fraserbacteria bacterium RBG_16_55_9]
MRNTFKVLAVVSLVAFLMPLMSIGQGGGTLDVVKGRGKLICGVNNAVPGFGFVDQQGNFSGFDIDYCRAVAAAVLGDPNAVEFRPLSAAARFTALSTGEIDVLSRNTTWTFLRDVDLKTNFAPTTFYDGQGFMVRASSSINTLTDLNGATVCVLQGTTTEQNLADLARRLNITINPLVFPDSTTRDQAYDQGRCDALTTDASQLAAVRTTLSNPADHKILADLISKEPLGPVVRHGDDQWLDIVTWTVFCTIAAEELGVTSGNVGDQISSSSPEVRRLLGVEGDFGTKFGLANAWCVNVLKSTGNYGEIYARNLTPLQLPRDGSLNALYTNGGLLYSPPFR